MVFTNTKNKKTTFTRLLWVLVCMFSIQLTFSKNIYVNDGSLVRDVYTTAIGNNANSGLTPALPKATLNGALTTAIAGDTIYIDTGTWTNTGTYVGINHTINIAVTIIGAGPGNTIFNGNASINRFASITANNVTIKNMMLFNYYLQASDGQVVTMNGRTGILFENVVVKANQGSPTAGVNFLLTNSTVTLRACLFSCSGWNADGGGAFRADNSTVLVDYCIFKNSKNFANSGQGGAIELSGSNPNVTIKNTVFDECSAQMGGAIFQGGTGISTLTVTNSKFVNNFTAGDGSDPANGGGAFASKAAAGSLSSFTNCVFTNNKVDRDGDQNASSDGGAILFRSASGTFVFNKCSFSNISTSSYDKGQDFYISKGTSLTGTISNCIFSGSTNTTGGSKVNIYNANLAAADYSVTNSNTWTRSGTAPAITDALAPVWDPTFSAPNTPTPNTANLVACGVVANCTTDTNPPLIIKCVDDKTLYCPNSLPDYRAELSVFDDCTTAIVQSPAPGVVLTVGPHTVTMTVTDANGNVSTCTFIVTVAPAPAATNFGDFASAVQITANAVSQFKNTSGSGANLIGSTSFSGNLGTYFANSGLLKLTGAEIRTSQNNPGTVCSSVFYWIVYPLGSRPANPIFSTFAIPYKVGCIDSDANSIPDKFGDLLGPCTSFNDKKWSTVAQAIDLTAYANGNYTLETYYNYTGSETGDCLLDAKTQYINNSCGNYTANFTLSVASCTNPVITVQPIVTQTRCLNLDTTQISVTATGALLTYQWYSNAVNNVTTGTLLPLETNSTFTAPSNSVGILYYYCIVSSVTCSVTTSTSAVVTNANPDAPIVGAITQPTCALATGSVALSGLLATGTWTVTTTPGGFTTTGSGTTTTFSGLVAGTYTFTVTNAVGCTSVASASSATINNQDVTPAAPIVGAITQPTCALATGSVALSALPASGTWTVTTTPGGFTTTGTGTTTTFSGLVAGTYTFTVTNASTCTSVASASSATINIQPVTPAAPIVGVITQPTCALATGSVALSGLPATGTWTVTTTPGGFTTTGSGTTTTFSGLVAGTYTFTVTNAVGCTSAASTSSATIKNQDVTPAAPIVGVITQPTCALATGSVALSGLPATGTWTVTTTPGGFTTTGTGTTTTFSGLVAGTYTFTVTNASACTSVASTSSATITSQPVTPTAPIVGAITQPTCALATGSVALSGLPATGTWTVTTTPGGFTTTGSGTTTTFSGLVAGTYTFTVTNASACTSVASASSATISIQPVTPAAPIVGVITQPTCALATGSVALSGLPATGTWTVTTTPGGFTTTGTGTTTTFSGLVAGTYTFTVTNASACTSVASTSSATITSQPVTPTAPIVGVITQPTCALATGSIALSGLPATGTWTVTTTPGGFTTTGSGTTTTFSGLVAGTYTFTVTNASACTSVASASSATINIQPVTPSAPIGAANQAFCAINTPTVASLSATGTGIIWYATATSITALSSTDLLISGNYYATQTIGICESDTRLIVAVAITEIPNVILFDECDGTDYTITATTLNAEIGLTYEWFIAMNMSQNIGSSVSLIVSVKGTYIVRITKNGCSEDFSLIVDNSYCGIPRGISPNNDNLNDIFDLSNFKVRNLQIFNRYGMEMYRKANYVNEWNGQTNDGQELPDGTYYYVIEFQNKSTKVGWVYKNSEY